MLFVLALSSNLFFFNDTATTEIYTLSLHDALPIFASAAPSGASASVRTDCSDRSRSEDRKSTRLNSSHVRISYAVCCLKKKTHDWYAVHADDHACLPPPVDRRALRV